MSGAISAIFVLIMDLLSFRFLSDQSPRRADTPRSTPGHCTRAAEVPTFVPVHSTVGGISVGTCGGIPGRMTSKIFKNRARLRPYIYEPNGCFVDYRTYVRYTPARGLRIDGVLQGMPAEG